jgi:hypothetical protein
VFVGSKRYCTVGISRSTTGKLLLFRKLNLMVAGNEMEAEKFLYNSLTGFQDTREKVRQRL